MLFPQGLKFQHGLNCHQRPLLLLRNENGWASGSRLMYQHAEINVYHTSAEKSGNFQNFLKYSPDCSLDCKYDRPSPPPILQLF